MDTGNLVERRKGRSKAEDEAGSSALSTSPSSTFPHLTPNKPAARSSNKKSGRSSFLLSPQTILVLCIGILTGYVVLPMLLVEINMDDYMSNMGDSSSSGTTGSNRLRERTLAGAKDSQDHVQQRLVEDHMVLSKQSLPTSTSPTIMHTLVLSDHKRKKILVTGGAGFVGSHLVDKLMMEGHEVIVVDNFFTGQKKNIAHWLHHPNFRYVNIVCVCERLED